jgi:hypothetical protein
MPSKRGDDRSGEAPRTDLTPERDPYYDGYFGTDEEEGVERERDAGEPREADRRADEESAGGDRELFSDEATPGR